MTPSLRWAALAFALVGCGGAADTAPASPTPAAAPPAMRIVALSQPVGWLSARLAGDLARVEVLVPAGEDPPHWQPDADALAALAGATLVVAQGAGYEPWIGAASLPRDRLVDTTTGLDLISREAVTHQHGHGHAHTHTATDPHTWLDPLTFLAQGQTIHRRLLAVAPHARATLDERLGALRADLLAAHARMETSTRGLAGVPLAANHPSYDYLARRYGFRVHTIDIDPAATPTADAQRAVGAWVEQAGPRPVLLWESAPVDPAHATLPPALRHVIVDPVEQPVDGAYDWITRFDAVGRALHALVPSHAVE